MFNEFIKNCCCREKDSDDTAYKNCLNSKRFKRRHKSSFSSSGSLSTNSSIDTIIFESPFNSALDTNIFVSLDEKPNGEYYIQTPEPDELLLTTPGYQLFIQDFK